MRWGSHCLEEVKIAIVNIVMHTLNRIEYSKAVYSFLILNENPLNERGRGRGVSALKTAANYLKK